MNVHDTRNEDYRFYQQVIMGVPTRTHTQKQETCTKTRDMFPLTVSKKCGHISEFYTTIFCKSNKSSWCLRIL